MSTRFKGPRAKFLRNVACLTLVSAAAAGCSEGAARFTDPLFTASVPQQPQLASQFGGATQVASVASRVRQNVPQRLDVLQPQFSQQDTFNAKNLGSGVISAAGIPQQLNTQPQQAVLGQQFPSFPSRPTLTQQPSSIARQSLPPVQQLPQSSILASTPSNGGRLTLAQAQAINDPEAGPQIGQGVPLNNQLAAAQVQPSTGFGAPQQSFEVGTDWTRKYSPIPTQSPAPKLSSTLNGSGPKAYTPPQGVYTADVDRLSTSSISRFTEPKVIRSSVTSSPTAQVIRSQPTQIDRQVTASVPASAQSQKSNNGWSNAGGTYVALKSGETLYSLSRRYGVPVDAIASSNGITNPSTVRVGQKILIPTYVYAPNVGVSAPDANKRVANASSGTLRPQTVRSSVDPTTTASIAPARSLAPKVATNGQSFGAHKVQSGDTLSKIGRLHGTSVASIKAANGISDGNVIRVGQVLSIPGSKQAASNVSAKQSVAALPRLDKSVTGFVPSQPLPAVVSPTNRVAAVPRSRPNYAAAKTVARGSTTGQPKVNPVRRIASVQTVAPTQKVAPAVDPITTASTKNPTATSSSGFKWPVRGDVVGHFGQKNAGINIAVPEGTPVRAAAAGEVIYAANGLADYGQLVLVRHSNGFVTAYAHNKALTVKRGERVRQGQVVAKSGKSGSVSSPQLHFEIRDGKTPVNPMAHLAG
ncbi:MAG: peptidoglycan DD-metalloendopeptidase family protein [Hyphomicrobiales bacterium]